MSDLLKAALGCLLVATLPMAACGESVGLAWKPSPSVGATGYNVYYGVSGSFTNKQDAGNVTSTRINDLQAGKTYFFYATTYDATGDESGPSEVVVFTVNSPPTAQSLFLLTTRERGTAVALAGHDPDGNSLTYEIVSSPTHGALSGTAPALVYTPAPGFLGTDAFTYRVHDGKVNSQIATVSVAVIAPTYSAPPADRIDPGPSPMTTADPTAPHTPAPPIEGSPSVSLGITKPAVSILYPASGAILSGMATAVVQVKEDSEALAVDLYLDGDPYSRSSAAGGIASLSLETTAVRDGPHTLTFGAVDGTGMETTVSVDVRILNAVSPIDLTPPVVSIIAPQHWTTIAGDFDVEIRSSDNMGVALVQLYCDGELIGASTTPNSSFTILGSELTAGQHSFQANALDAANNHGYSNAITVIK